MIEKDKNVDEFLKWLKEEKDDAHLGAMGSASSWNHAYSSALDKVFLKAKKLLKNKQKVSNKKL